MRAAFVWFLTILWLVAVVVLVLWILSTPDLIKGGWVTG